MMSEDPKSMKFGSFRVRMSQERDLIEMLGLRPGLCVDFRVAWLS
jgi:hypothetical protein